MVVMPNSRGNEDDDASVNSGGSGDDSIVSSDRTSSGMQTQASRKGSLELAKRETRLVSYLRFSVIAVLIAATVGVSVAIYRVTSSEETRSFESDFIGFSSKVIESFEINVEHQLGAMHAFGLALTSHAKSTNATWPNVVLPDYERRAYSFLAQNSAISLLTNPIVTKENRASYEKFTAENYGWFQDGLDFQAEGGYRRKNNFRTNSSQAALSPKQLGDRGLQDNTTVSDLPDFSSGIADTIFQPTPTGAVVDRTAGPYFPLWMNAPALSGSFVENVNMALIPLYTKGFEDALQKKASLGSTMDLLAPTQFEMGIIDTIHKLLTVWELFEGGTVQNPIGLMYYPIFEDVEAASSKVVGVLTMFLHWRQLFDEILPVTAKGIIVVFENTCDQAFTYRIDGRNVEYLGNADRHDPQYDKMEQSVSLTEYFNEREGTYYSGVPLSDENCQYSLRVYPSQETEDEYITSTPLLYTIGAILIFVCTSLLFLAYDLFVEHRQRLVMRNALRSGAIVQSLFPDAIRDRLMQEDDEAKQKNKKYMSNNQRVKSFLNDDQRDEGLRGAKPIADLFPNTTVMFADIANFTAWSSTRDPGQVFLLLQTIYQDFDKIARRRKVFKVETVGDCYVAATGIPDPQENHALKMARFAQDCLYKFNELTKSLEVSLGPDTGDLKIRFGLHSGPVTAGVLRGDKSRFQLFGDTVNSASRMESSGIPNRIHISKATADLLIKGNKGSWVVPRQDEVRVKGKGIIKTYWLLPSHKYTKSQVSLVSNVSDSQHEAAPTSRKERRLIDWNVEVLSSHLRRVVARRNAMTATDKKSSRSAHSAQPDLRLASSQQKGKMALDEVKEAIVLPKFDPKVAAREDDPESITLDPKAVAQLKSYVTCIASMYHANPFHNFEHASHVTMSVDKLLKRIVTPDLQADNSLDQALHDYTHGITSDPLTHFGVVFSALIHDVDHRGVSNAQLGKEMPHLATVYKNKSIAEQNSIDVAWDLLMSPDFADLRWCIYGNRTQELARFRQIVINVVLATDIFDKELGDLRKGRWQKAFSEQHEADSNLKATIVLEHLIQASDVSHTMQHWHVYRKWNECLFLELYQAFEAGRMGSDPSTFWAQGEIGFFDNYVIPLAKKLSECKVFGVSSDEYLNYAQDNRDEWAQKGPKIVAEMVQKYCKSGVEIEIEGDDKIGVVPFE